MSNKVRKWIRAGTETLIHGGTAAFIVGLTAPAIIGQTWLPFFSTDWWKMVFGQFAANGGVRFFLWWQANPLPPEDTDPGMGLPAAQISMNPLGKVVPAPAQPEIPKP